MGAISVPLPTTPKKKYGAARSNTARSGSGTARSGTRGLLEAVKSLLEALQNHCEIIVKNMFLIGEISM